MIIQLLPLFMSIYWGVCLWAESFVNYYVHGISKNSKIIVMRIIP
jgi:hypothetical protein